MAAEHIPENPGTFGERILRLSEEIRGGSKAAEGELCVALYRNPLVLTGSLRRTLLGILPLNLVDVEDVALEVFGKILTAIKNEQLPQVGSSVLPWIRRVFINAAINVSRRPQFQHEMADSESSLAALTANGMNPERAVLLLEKVRQGEKCISELSERQNATFLLWRAGATIQQTGDQLGIRDGTVAATRFQAKNNFVACMESHGFDIAA